MALAPRYDYGPDQDMGDPTLYFVILLMAALGIGYVAPKRSWLVGVLLGLPGLVLSPWTAPRGDNDGLWLLIVPMLGVFVVILIAMARIGSWVRSHFPPSNR